MNVTGMSILRAATTTRSTAETVETPVVPFVLVQIPAAHDLRVAAALVLTLGCGGARRDSTQSAEPRRLSPQGSLRGAKSMHGDGPDSRTG